MATQKKTTSKKTADKKTVGKTTAVKAAVKKTAAKKTPAKNSGGSVKKGVKTSASTAKQTGVKRTNVTQYEKRTTASGKAASHKMSAGGAKAKKESLIKQKRSTGEGPACWPGFERVPGKEAGTKGSCKPKKNQTGGERKEDAREAAGSKLRKAGGNKGKANRAA